MDSTSDATLESYEGVFDPDTGERSDSVQQQYSGGPISADLLFVDRMQRDGDRRGYDFHWGRRIVRRGESPRIPVTMWSVGLAPCTARRIGGAVKLVLIRLP